MARQIDKILNDMKKILILLIFLYHSVLEAQCQNNIIFETQVTINSFASQ